MSVSINSRGGSVTINKNANVRILKSDISPIVQNGLVLNLDAETLLSYPTTGNRWYDISNERTRTTLTNGPVFNSENGGFIVFDGTNDYGIGNPSPTSLLNVGNSGNATVEMVFKLITTPPLFGVLFSYGQLENFVGQSYSLKINSAANLTVTAGNTNFFINNPFTTGLWYHIVVIFRIAPNPLLFYRNGVSISNASQCPPVEKTADFYYVGGNLVQFINANIGLVRVYNRELTATEVTQNFNVSRWRFGI